MATEIVRLCDAHLFTDERVQATAHAVTLDGKTGTVDLCQDHAKTLLGPLLDLLQVDRASTQGRKVVPGPAACFLCDTTCHPGRMGPHLKHAHHTTLEAVYGLTCPVCLEAKVSVQGVGTHGRLTHGRDGVADLWVSVEEAGDPDGVVAARKAGALRGDRP